MKTILTLLLLSGTALADDRILCLQDRVVLSEVNLTKEGYKQWYFTFTAQNFGNVPVSWVGLEYEIVTPGRSVPWATGKAGVNIPGGIEGNEYRELKVFYPEGYELTQTPFDYKLRLKVGEVRDAAGQPMQCE